MRMPASPAENLLSSLLEPVARCLTPDAARRLLEVRADQAAQDGIEELALASTEGWLSAEERSEYESYVIASSLLAILQARAREIVSGPTGS